MFPLQEGEKINVVLPLTGEMRSFPEDHYVFMATSMGTVKKTALTEFSNPRKAGIIAVGPGRRRLPDWRGADRRQARCDAVQRRRQGRAL